MNISALNVQNLAENSLLCHVQCCQFKEIIYTVFQLHTVFAGSFGSIYQTPNLLQCHGSGNFDSYVFAMFHSIHSHFRMVFPVSSHIHKVNIIPFTQLFPGVLITVIGHSLRQTGFLENVLGFFHTFLTYITQSLDLDTRNMCKTDNSSRTTHPQSDKSHAYRVHLGSS